MAEEVKPDVVTETGEAVQPTGPTVVPDDLRSPLGIDEAGETPLVAEPEVASGEGAPVEVTGAPVAVEGSASQEVKDDPDDAAPRTQDSQLTEKAAAYDYIANDPELSRMVNECISQRSGRIPQQAVPATAQGDDTPVTRAEFNKFSEALQHLVLRSSQSEIDRFRSTHSDFTGQVEQRVGQYVSKYGLPLEQAYLLDKAQNGGQLAAGRQPATVLPAEGRPGGGGRTPTVGNPMDEAREKIDELPRHGRDRLPDALKIAFDAAVKQHS